MSENEYLFPTCKYIVHDNFVIAQAKDFVDIYKTEIDQLCKVIKENKLKDFGLIEVRSDNVSINPFSYAYCKKIMPFFTAFALVSSNPKVRKAFLYETHFIEKEGITYSVFETLPEAIAWMTKTVSPATVIKSE